MANCDQTDMSPFGTKCLEITTLLANQGRDFSLTLKIGHQFSFHADSKGMRTFPARGSSADENRTKKKSASAIKRDRRRRIEFLKRKRESLSPATSKLDIPLATSKARVEDTSEVASSQTETLDISHTAQEGRSTGKINNSSGAHSDKQGNSSNQRTREGKRMKIKDLQRQCQLSLDEIGELKWLPEAGKWLAIPKATEPNRIVKCPSCDEDMSAHNAGNPHFCVTFGTNFS